MILFLILQVKKLTTREGSTLSVDETRNEFPWLLSGKESACPCRRCEFKPWGGKIPLEKEIASHSSILAREIPWTEEPGGLPSIVSKRVLHDLATEQQQVS